MPWIISGASKRLFCCVGIFMPILGGCILTLFPLLLALRPDAAK